MEAEVPGSVEEAQREVARPRVGAPAAEVEHGPPRAGAARLDDPAPGLPERPGDPGLPAGRPRFPAEQDPRPARSHVRLDQEPRPRAPRELRQVHAAARRILRPPSPEDARPRHGPAEEPALGRREEARDLRALDALEEALLAELARDPRQHGARVEAVEEAVEPAALRRPQILQRQVPVDDVDRHVAEPHAAPRAAELAPRSPAPRGCRPPGTRPPAAGPRCSRRGAPPPPRRRRPGGAAARAGARRPPPSARRGRGDRAGRRGRAPRARGRSGGRPPPAGSGRRRRGCRAPRGPWRWSRRAPGWRAPSGPASSPTSGRIMSCQGAGPRAASRPSHRAVVALTGQRLAEPRDVVAPEGGRVRLEAMHEGRQPRELGERAAGHEEGREGDRMRHRARARAVAVEEGDARLGRLHGPEELPPAPRGEPRDPGHGQPVERRHGSRIIGR